MTTIFNAVDRATQDQFTISKLSQISSAGDTADHLIQAIHLTSALEPFVSRLFV